MGSQRRLVRQRMLLPLLLVHWRIRGDRDQSKVCKDELLDYRCKDLELEAQLKDVRKQLDEYDRSREHEPSGKWNKRCDECGYVNHERHRFCESCGTSLVPEVRKVYVCPRCSAVIAERSHECLECGSRFWSPIILQRTEGQVCQYDLAEGPEGDRP